MKYLKTIRYYLKQAQNHYMPLKLGFIKYKNSETGFELAKLQESRTQLAAVIKIFNDLMKCEANGERIIRVKDDYLKKK